MEPPAAEATPLLGVESPADHHDPHNALFDSLDAPHAHDDIHDHPSTPDLRHVKGHLVTAASPMGLGHGEHHHLQSPALVLRLRQCIDHGFSTVWRAMYHRLHPSTPSPPHAPPSPAAAAAAAADKGGVDAQASRYTLVRAVFVVAVLTMLAMTSISPTLLLFMNECAFTSASNIAPYVTASALSTLAPVMSNIPLTAFASKFGPGRALSFGSFVAGIGLVVILFARGSLPLFFLGYALYSSSNSLRVVRISLLSKIVPPAERTTVLATHALMTPIGALLGPPVWIAAQNYRGSFSIFDGFFLVDRFTLVYTVTISAFIAIACVSTATLRHIVTFNSPSASADVPSNTQVDDSGADDATTGSLHPAVIHFSDGHDQTVDLQHYRNRIFIYFCLVWFGVNMSAGVYMTAFQPILVNVFETSDAKLGIIFEVIAIFAIVPPLTVAILSRRLMDRDILVIGLLIKLVGMALFQPLFGPIREWQVILGFLLIIKASIFFSTASMSLFTKLLGPMSTSYLLGLLASAASIGPAIAQILLSSRIVTWFGSAWFVLFALPALGSLLAILWPMQWRRLNPGCEFTRLVTGEAELQRADQA